MTPPVGILKAFCGAKAVHRLAERSWLQASRGLCRCPRLEQQEPCFSASNPCSRDLSRGSPAFTWYFWVQH